MFRHRNELPVEGMLPPFDGATAWLNSGPLTPAGLRGQVVLVNFGTYTCINWIRSLPYVRAWANKYAGRGLTVVGVQTPEFAFEGDLDNVGRAIKEMDVRYPVVVDNDYAVWQAFDNHYWPALYFVDAQGRIRHHHFGEGEYEQSEMVLQMLLREAGADIEQGLVARRTRRCRGGGRLGQPGITGELPRVRARRRLRLARSTWCPTCGTTYSAPAALRRNHWALSGDWRIGAVPALLNEPSGSISYQFHARDLHLVMGPSTAGRPVRFTVRLDGEPPGLAHGDDIDERGDGAADYQRIYQLIRQPEPINDRRFDIEFLDAGVEAFVFTFG